MVNISESNLSSCLAGLGQRGSFKGTKQQASELHVFFFNLECIFPISYLYSY